MILIIIIFLFRHKSTFKCEVGIQHHNFVLASQLAQEHGCGSRDYCALLVDEMMITSGIVYSVNQQKVFGLCEVAPHGIKNEIYQDFYEMKPDNNSKCDNPRTMSYFTDTAKKLVGHSATGLTQVLHIK